MSFSHLSFPRTDSESFKFIIEQLTSLTNLCIPPSQVVTKTSTPYFFPAFSEEDQIFLELIQANICNFSACPTTLFNFPIFPALSFNSKTAQPVLTSIFSFLQQPRIVEALIQDQNAPKELNISLVFSNFLKYLIQVSSTPQIGDEHLPQMWPAHPIQDIQLIGSHVLKLLQSQPFYYAACQFFGSVIKPDRIEKWFQMEHIKNVFIKEGNDYDFRIISPGNLTYQSFLSNQTLKYLANSIVKPFDAHFFMTKLKNKNPKYQNLNHSDEQNILKVKKFAVLEFSTQKRKIVDLPHTQYAILALKTNTQTKDHAKVADFTYVGIDRGKLSLENPNISTRNCWVISLYNLLTVQKKNYKLIIRSEPFTASKALIDLICGISTVNIPNVDAWCRFIKDCERSMQAIDEHERIMVKNVLAFKQDFLTRLKKSDSSLSLDPQQISDGHYLYYFIKNTLIHPPSKQVLTSFTTIVSYLFRACQSLHIHSNLSDQEFKVIWELANQAGWFQTDSSHTHNSDICIFLKQALVDEGVPFSIVSAWLSILTWQYHPKAATSHCQQPHFHIKAPFRCLLPIDLFKQGSILENYLNHLICPKSLQKIYHMMSSSYDLELVSFPLVPFFSQLAIEPSQLKKMAENWLNHSSTLLNILGMQIYLSICELCPEKSLLAYFFKKLPKFMRSINNIQHKEEMLKALQKITSLASLGYQQAIQVLLKQSMTTNRMTLKKSQWLKLLIETKDAELLTLAYHIWNEIPRKSSYQNLSWQLFHALCLYHPRSALSLLLDLNRSLFIKNVSNFTFPPVISLLKSYQLIAPQQLAIDADRIIPLVYPLFEKESLSFEKEHQKQLFSRSLSFFIDTLYQQALHKAKADYFLLEASRKGYLDKAWQTEKWIERLKELASNPQDVIFAISLYTVISEEKLWNEDPFTVPIQQLKITLGESLLLQQQEALSFALIQQFSAEELELRMVIPFHQWGLNLLKQQVSLPLTRWHTEILEIVLLATPPHKRFETHQELYPFFQHVTTILKSPSLRHNLPIDALDKFLSKEDLSSIFNQEDKNWKELLLNYLEYSLPFDDENRFSTLWKVYEHIMRLFNSTKSYEHSLQLFRLFGIFLEKPISPPPKVLEWFKNKHTIILKNLCHHQCLREVKSIVASIKKYKISNQSLAFYIWWICQQELQLPQSNSQLLYSLLDQESPKNLQMHIQASDYPLLPKLIALLLNADPSRPTQVQEWVDYCSNSNQQDLLNDLPLTDYYLGSANQLIKTQHPLKALELLKKLPSLSPSQQKRAEVLWIDIAQSLDTSTSIDTIRFVFFDENYLKMFIYSVKEWSLVAQELIKKRLNATYFPQSEKELLLDLIKKYSLMTGSEWLKFWKILDVKSPDDQLLIPKVWTIFQKQQKNLIGTSLDIAACWTQAFEDLEQLDHPDLLDYFYDQDWIQSVFNEQTLPVISLKWNSLKAIFFKAITKLSPTSFDNPFFEEILLSKINVTLTGFVSQLMPSPDDFITLHIEGAKEKDISQTPKEILFTNPLLNYAIDKYVDQLKSNDFQNSVIALTDKWNRDIELALIQKLYKTSDPICLLAVCRLLYCPFQVNLVDPNLYQTYLFYFEHIFSSFLTISSSLDKENHQHTSLVGYLYRLAQDFCKQESIPTMDYIPLVKTLLTVPNSNHLKLIMKLVSKILNKGTSLEIEALKPHFLTLIPLLLKEENKKDYLDIVKNYLKKAFKLMKLSAEEKCKLSYFYFNEEFMLNKHILNDEMINQLLSLYLKWAPYLFNNSTYLREALHQTAKLIIPYANSKDSQKFAENLHLLLDVKYRILPHTKAIPPANISYYQSLVLQMIWNFNPESLIFLNAYKDYIYKKIELANSSQFDKSEVIELIKDFSSFFAPQPPIFEEENKEHLPIKQRGKFPPHQIASEELLKHAFNSGIFKQNMDSLTSLELWLNCHLSKQNATTSFSKSRQELMKTILQKFLKYHTPYCIYRAIEILNVLHVMHIHTPKFTYILDLYKTILEEIEPHIKTSLQTENDTLPIFGHLLQYTLNVIIVNNSSSRRHLGQIATLYYTFSLKWANLLQKDENDTTFYAYYINSCLSLLKHQINYGVFEQNYALYLRHLEELIPHIKLIEVSRTIKQELVPINSLMTTWLNALIRLPSLTKDPSTIVIKPAVKKQQRALLFKWFNFFLILEGNPARHCESLLVSLNEIFHPTTFDSYWMNSSQEDAVFLFKSIKETIESNSDDHQQIKLDLIHLQFYREELRKNYPDYLDLFSHLLTIVEKAKFSDTNLVPFKALYNDLLHGIVNNFPSNSLAYFPERQKLFLHFIHIIRSLWQKNSVDLSFENQELLLDILVKGIDYNFLQEENESSMTDFEWAKNLIKINLNYATYLNTLELLFYKKSKPQERQHQVMMLMPSLYEHIIKQKDFSYSYRFIQLIYTLPIPIENQFHLFLTWLRLFFYHHLDNPTQQEVCQHMNEIAIAVKNQGVFNNIARNTLFGKPPSPLIKSSDFTGMEQILKKIF